MEVIQAVEITEEEAKKIKEENERTVRESLLPEEKINSLGEPLNEENAKGFIKKCAEYVKNGGFTNRVRELSAETKIPEKKIAKNFIQKVLGTIGDKTVIVGNTLEDLVKAFLNILHFILKKAVEIIIKAAKLLMRLITFNYTCVGSTPENIPLPA